MEEQTRNAAYDCWEKTVLKRKNALSQYNDLVREIEEVEQRISKTERDLQHYTITGFPNRDYVKMTTLLNTRKSILHALKSEIEQSINDVQVFIAGLDNSHDRRIVTMRVIDKMSWKQIARNIGGGNTADSVRMAFNRILEREDNG